MLNDPVTEPRGDFDIHLTVRPVPDGLVPDAADRLAELAARHGCKFTDIELARGAVRTQPMVTGTGSGTLAAQRALAAGWARTLRAEGYEVIRTKIEAAPWNDGVPADDQAAAREPAGRYFEHHVKLLLDAAELDGLAAAVEPYGAHLSRNARRERQDGRHERFVTQRCHAVGQAAARRRLATLVDAVRARGHRIVSVEEEYVMVDDNTAIDAGWIAA
ncbi:hypothetical protein [Micromonospora vulcania]|uniref:Ankyrin n=1 Tax=Micromonospora vulcania TaxID=1441873 RepID=A0ABW1H128_9ACTN